MSCYVLHSIRLTSGFFVHIEKQVRIVISVQFILDSRRIKTNVRDVLLQQWTKQREAAQNRQEWRTHTLFFKMPIFFVQK